MSRIVPVLSCFLLTITLLGGAVGCRAPAGNSAEDRARGQSTEPAGAPLAVAPLSVAVAPVQARSVRRALDFVGTLHANEEVAVSSEVEGRLIRIGFDLGDRVSRGEVLARIDDRELDLKLGRALSELRRDLAQLGLGMDGSGHDGGRERSAGPERKNASQEHPEDAVDIERISTVLRARAGLEDATSHLERIKALYENRVVSRQEYDTAMTRFTLAQAGCQVAREEARSLIASVKAKRETVALARKELSDTAVLSPLDGYVYQRHVSVGEHVKVGTTLFTLVDTSPIKLRGEVAERFAAELRVGQTVEAAVEAFPGRVFPGELRRISPAADRETRSVLIEALLPNPDGRLKPGFFVKGAIVARAADQALMAPADALVSFAGVTKVFVIEDGQAQERLVQVGRRVGEEIEILQGVKVGEQVAISGLTRLSQGKRVKLTGQGARGEGR